MHHLRELGYNVTAIIEDARGCSDEAVMAQAVREGRLILTFDRDYGELIYRLGLSPPAGVIYFRDNPRTPLEPAKQLVALLKAGDIEFEGKFIHRC